MWTLLAGFFLLLPTLQEAFISNLNPSLLLQAEWTLTFANARSDPIATTEPALSQTLTVSFKTEARAMLRSQLAATRTPSPSTVTSIFWRTIWHEGCSTEAVNLIAGSVSVRTGRLRSAGGWVTDSPAAVLLFLPQAFASPRFFSVDVSLPPRFL